MEPHVLLTVAHRRSILARDSNPESLPRGIGLLACRTLCADIASVLRIDYLSNAWNPHRTILQQYVTENVIDTGGCCDRRKTLLPGRVPHELTRAPGKHLRFRHLPGHTLRIRFARRGRVIVFAPGGDLAT
jgi:hypothetical protein